MGNIRSKYVVGVLFLGLIYLSKIDLQAQSTHVLTCTVYAGQLERNNAPVTLNLNNLNLDGELDKLSLREIDNGVNNEVPFQLSNNRLHWILTGKSAPGSKRTFALTIESQKKYPSQPSISFEEKKGAYTMLFNDKPILSYQHKEVDVPAESSTLNRRGGFIHPIWSPQGNTLTRIQPPDHFHHYGIWNPWTKTNFQGKEIDFWNLYKGQGTVRPVGTPKKTTGPVFGEVTSELIHVDLLDKTNEKTALLEQWRIRGWNVNSNYWIIDFKSRLDCANDSLFTIKAYSYQGFGYRAVKSWNDQNVSLLTSEGKDKSDGNATRARWCIVQGLLNDQNSGILFMTHPTNHNFPEQLRIWPIGSNAGKENVFVNFNPAQEEDWNLKPGTPNYLNYRMLVFDGSMSSEQAEKFWQDYAYPPKVEVNLVRNKRIDKVLVYTKNGEGYVHDNLESSVQAIKKLGQEHGFNVDASEDPNFITEENLKQYQAIILSNTNNETFDTDEQKLAFQRYIQAGGGLVGIHSATGSERDWPWFWKVMGGKFRRHPPLQNFEINVIDPDHPSVNHLQKVWNWEDECYYIHHLNPGMHVILAADLTTVEDDKKEEYPGSVFGDLMPLSWSQELYGGRQWYTALGHKIEYYSDPEFTQHLLGGILWVIENRKFNYSRASKTLQHK